MGHPRAPRIPGEKHPRDIRNRASQNAHRIDSTRFAPACTVRIPLIANLSITSPSRRYLRAKRPMKSRRLVLEIKSSETVAIEIILAFPPFAPLLVKPIDYS